MCLRKSNVIFPGGRWLFAVDGWFLKMKLLKLYTAHSYSINWVSGD